MDRGHKPAAGPGSLVVERGAVSVLGVFGVNDGGAPVAQGLLAGLEIDLGLVAPPGAILNSHDGLTEAGGGGDWRAVNLVPIVPVRIVLYLRGALNFLL